MSIPSTDFTPANLPVGPWQLLLRYALALLDDAAKHGGVIDPVWTFGGGTVLMLRHNHRHSKDIDIFVPDPQYLGFFTPRLSDVADAITQQYIEGSGYVKLQRPEGEIDFVASPNLTKQPFERWTLLGRSIRVETSAEIVAKKLFHRGDRATARDLFDLALVIQKEPESLRKAKEFLLRHRDTFVEQLHTREIVIGRQYAAIDRLEFMMEFEDARALATEFLSAL